MSELHGAPPGARRTVPGRQSGRNSLDDLPPPHARRAHQHLRERRLNDVAQLNRRAVARVRFVALRVRFALVVSPNEKTNAS